MKSVTFRRITAFFIDILLVTLATNLFTAFIPVSDKVKDLNAEQNSIYKDYLKKKITSEEYAKKINDTGYQISKETLYIDIITDVLAIGYFVIYQYKNKGKTLGKHLMKIKIEKTNKTSLSLNDLVIRSLIINSLFVSIISMIMIMVLPKKTYIEFDNIIYLIQGSVIMIIIFMINIRKDKRGLHDLITNTRVIAVEEEK